MKIAIAVLLLCLLAACRPVQDTDCGQAGQSIGAGDLPTTCCAGLTAVGGWPGGYTGDCSLPPPPTGLRICSNCGDGHCDVDSGENTCNCADC